MLSSRILRLDRAPANPLDANAIIWEVLDIPEGMGGAPGGECVRNHR
jgi:hypothetical protein